VGAGRGRYRANAVGSAGGALPGPAGALLAVDLLGATDHLAAAAGVVGAQARIGLLHHHILVHQRDIRLDAEDILAELDAPDLLAGLIIESCFHMLFPISSYVAGAPATHRHSSI